LNTRFRILLMGLGGALLTVVLLGVLFPREPVYQGRRLSVWLREVPSFSTGFSDPNQPAKRALQHVGTNAIPFLMERLQSRDPQWKVDGVRWLESRYDVNFTAALAEVKREQAVNGFFALGRIAEPAIPELSALVTGADKGDALYALAALQAIGGPQTMPVVFSVLTNDDSFLREGALRYVGNFRSHARAAVPVLVKNLDANEKSVRASAAAALGQIGLAPELAVPALIQCLAVETGGVRREAVLALAAFGTNAIAALPALRALAESPDEELRRAARVAVVRVQCELRDGAIIRGPKDQKRLALVFTGHEYGEGGETILDELAKHQGRASFFLTGAFLTNSSLTSLVRRMQEERHYLGPHSDQHLLYCSWDAGRTNLVTEEEFQADLAANVAKLPAAPEGFRRFSRYFLPPYEHYNRDIADWTRASGWTLINYTPGTRSHADYTGEADKNFASSQKIFDSILARERDDPNGLNGFILLLHVGCGPGRTDKFPARFGELLDVLAGRGYEFVRVDELLRPPRDPNFPGGGFRR
jgi:peptidoglycan/xylan/chitin deacetylase (PgdA/CDA1 family)